MPIYFDNCLIWVDSNNAITLSYPKEVLINHLKHVRMLIYDEYAYRDEGLWMPCGDKFNDSSSITYRLVSFGSRFIVINYNNVELLLPISDKLVDQVDLLINTL